VAVGASKPHFVQRESAAVFIGTGASALTCTCGQTLIEGYEQPRYLGLAIQCGGCGSVIETPGLPAGRTVPTPVVIAEEVAETVSGRTLPVGATLFGRAEMDRVIGLYRPRTPASNVYSFTEALLDEAEASAERLTGGALPEVAAGAAEGLARHALAWSLRHLRGRWRAGAWSCFDDSATAIACNTVAGFQHFTATWGQHPMFPAMVATAGARGFSAHGLALFAAGHCMLTQNNRVGFPAPSLETGQIELLRLATGPSRSVDIVPHVFDRFEVPWGRAWSPEALRKAVQEAVEAEQGRINPRHPGMLLLSPGSALAGFDEALIQAIQAVVQDIGRRHRSLMAIAPIVLRLVPGQVPTEVQFGYGLFPVENRQFKMG
jgi:hypothetical protein